MFFPLSLYNFSFVYISLHEVPYFKPSEELLKFDCFFFKNMLFTVGKDAIKNVINLDPLLVYKELFVQSFFFVQFFEEGLNRFNIIDTFFIDFLVVIYYWIIDFNEFMYRILTKELIFI